MRYDYKCPDCGHIKEVSHGMTEEVTVLCPECAHPMYIQIQPVDFQMTKWGNRSVRKPDTPSNAEYSAYKAWEAEGGEPGTDAHKRFLQIKGEI